MSQSVYQFGNMSCRDNPTKSAALSCKVEQVVRFSCCCRRAARLNYNQPENSLHFSRRLLNLQINHEAMESLQSKKLSSYVNGLIRRHPTSGEDEIAQHLSICGRHLSRKISVEGVNFKRLLNEVRLQLATN